MELESVKSGDGWAANWHGELYQGTVGPGTSDRKLSWNVRLELDDKFDLCNMTHQNSYILKRYTGHDYAAV